MPPAAWLRRAAGVAAAASLGFGGCRCEERTQAPPLPPPLPIAAEPAGPPIPGLLCLGEGERIDPPAGALRVGPVLLREIPHWVNPPEGASRRLLMPGVNEISMASPEVRLLHHLLPGSDQYGVLQAKVHEFPGGSTFDAPGARAIFDVVAANPTVLLLETRALTWAGRPAVEGAIAVPFAGRRTLVHHLIVQTEGTRGLVVTFVAPEDQYHRYLAETCDAVAAVK
jgi:hypothetical protein